MKLSYPYTLTDAIADPSLFPCKRVNYPLVQSKKALINVKRRTLLCINIRIRGCRSIPQITTRKMLYTWICVNDCRSARDLFYVKRQVFLWSLLISLMIGISFLVTQYAASNYFRSIRQEEKPNGCRICSQWLAPFLLFQKSCPCKVWSTLKGTYFFPDS